MISNLLYLIVSQDNLNFVAEFGQSLWQGPYHVCQSAGFREGHTLQRRDKNNAQQTAPCEDSMTPNKLHLEDAPGIVKRARPGQRQVPDLRAVLRLCRLLCGKAPPFRGALC